MLPWVSVLENNVLFGPIPSKEENVRFLAQKHGVTVFVDMRPTKKDTDNIADWVNSNPQCHYARLPFKRNPEKEAAGRFKKERNIAMVQIYIQHAKLIRNAFMDNTSVFYLFFKTGYHDEEVFISMALWYKDQIRPEALIDWIDEKEYTYWLDDNADKKALLALLLREVKKNQEGLFAYFRKKE